MGGMCDLYQCMGPLLKVLTEQIDFSVLRDDPMDMAPGGDYAGALLQERNDPR